MEHVFPHYKLAITIVNHGVGPKAANAAKCTGAVYSTVIRGRGTAKSKFLQLLGLDDWERDVVLSFVPQTCLPGILEAINDKVHLDKPGNGVAFVLGVDKVTTTVAKLLKENHNTSPETKEENIMDNQNQHELIISIVNRGFADAVVEAAREAGARGGTVMHGSGNGIEQAIKFFDISIEQDTDVVLTLIEKEKTQAVLDAIMKNPECVTGKVLAFTLGVEQTVGLNVSHHD